MGTRNLTIVIKDGKYVVAQYGQWDGYPSGNGVEILNFLKDNFYKGEFEKKLELISFLTDEEADEIDNKFIPEYYALHPQVNALKELYPYLSRDMGAGILNYIMENNIPLKLTNSIEFAGNSLMCEWAYVIDLDKNVLEVYKGWNKRALGKKQRFYSISRYEGYGDNEYHQIRLKKSFNLNDLPTEEEFIRILE